MFCSAHFVFGGFDVVILGFFEYLNPWKGKSLGMVYHDKYIVFRVKLSSQRGGLELGNICWSI